MRSIQNLFLASTVSLISCGVLYNEGDSGSSGQPEPEVSPSPEQTKVDAVFSGYVMSAFEIEVDGERYSDMEDFYTKELARLPQKIHAAGYSDASDVRFEAELGISDLWADMRVFVVATGERGYQAESRVADAGKFLVNFPAAATNETYRVRANKRISISFVSESKLLRMCYNFSALDQSVLFSEAEKPIILDKFSSSITAYDCSAQSKTSGLSIPSQQSSEATAEELPKLMAKGMSKEDALRILGSTDLIIESATKWCWNSPGFERSNVCATKKTTSCHCFVEFDAEARVSAQSNIRGEMLDVLSFD
jgi:hypothetical protein